MEPYKQGISAIGLSIQRNTGRVPADDYYYVVLYGEIKGRHRSLRQAQNQYRQILAETGYTPASPEQATIDPAQEAVERYMDQLEDYWSRSHKHTRRGGKTMYRG